MLWAFFQQKFRQMERVAETKPKFGIGGNCSPRGCKSTRLAHDMLREEPMFGKIAKLFKKSAGAQSETPFSQTPPATLAQPARQGTDFLRRKGAAAPSAPAASGDSIAVPFSAILPIVPKELQGRGAASSGS